MKLADRKTVKGVVKARCPKCEEYKPLDLESFYLDKQGEPYLGHCRACERVRSAAWHRAKRAELKDAKSAPKPKATAKKTSAKRNPRAKARDAAAA